MDSEMTDVGPGELMTDSDAPFLLSRTEWLALQTYVAGNIALPVAEPGLRGLLMLGSQADIEPFRPVLPAFSAMKTHAIEWRDKGFPATVCLANDVINYAEGTDLFYGAAQDVANALAAALKARLAEADGEAVDVEADPEIALLRDDLGLVLATLRMEADTFAMRCEVAQAKLTRFSNQTKADKTTLDGLVTTYEARAAADSPESMRLANEIMDEKQILDEANEEYEHATIVAATTPTYAWIGFPLFPVGLIAGAVVAGVFGDKAVKAKGRAEAAAEMIRQLEADQRALGLSLTATRNAAAGLGTLSDKAGEALLVLQRMQGAWSRLSSVLTSIEMRLGKLDADTAEFLLRLQLRQAVVQWATVSDVAEQFVANAFVEVSSTATVLAA